MKKTVLFLTLFLGVTLPYAQTVQVGSGSYTTVFPGTDSSDRNSYPEGDPQLSGKVADKPCPTNDWWSALIKEDFATNLYAYPFAMKTVAEGVVVSYVFSGVMDDLQPITIGLPSLNVSQVTVSDFSDWMITMNWDNQLEVTSGLGMPFIYVEKSTTEPMQVTINSGVITVMDEIILVENCKNGADFAIYAPTGSEWSVEGSTYTSTLNNQDYLSVAFLPMNCTDYTAKAEEFQKYAYIFPTNTTATYVYDEANALVTTTFSVETTVKEGTNSTPIMGMLPHHWSALSSSNDPLLADTYTFIRGELKTIEANQFTVEKPFYGILSTLPFMGDESETYSASAMQEKVQSLKNNTLDTWTDSYNEGQQMNMLIQTARIAAETGDDETLQKLLSTVQTRLEDWLSYETGEVAFLFYYLENWGTIVGYPSGHSQDSNLNDHHFHWGYFIHAAAFVEQYNPGWTDQWGDMVNMLVRDAASNNRDDEMFPYLRNFSPFAGHCWANGFATFAQGNDQESTSESMQFNSSLIHWGSITGNDEIRDLGIYLYTTEQSAVEDYWFDMHDRTFTSSQNYSLVSRVWGNDIDNGTFWTSDIAACYGIELYPIHGGSLYLGHDIDYVDKLWEEIKSETEITENVANSDLWYDTMWKFAAFIDPTEALEMYESYPDRGLKFGVSDAHTYYWLHSMKALGHVSTNIQADYPVAAVFDRSGRITYVAHNYGKESITVNYSDGYQMQVPAGTMHYEQAGELVPEVRITSPSKNTQHAVGSAITIEATAADYTDSPITQVAFYVNDTLIGIDYETPYSMVWASYEGTHILSCTATNEAGKVGTSSSVSILVSDEVEDPYTSNEATSGSFSDGYTASFVTVGTDVTFQIELFDADKQTGLVAYFWNHTDGFVETSMTSLGNSTFTITLTDQVVGETIRARCKFAYAGGSAVTKYFDYVVEEIDYSQYPPQVSITSPSNNMQFSVSEQVTIVAGITEYVGLSISQVDFYIDEVLVASDREAPYSYTWVSTEGTHTFSCSATDANGKVGTSQSITVLVSDEIEDPYTSNEATSGEFSTGYTASFETDGTDVTFQIELLDTDKVGVVAYLWNNTNGFEESSMTSLGNNTFTVTLTDQVVGTTLTVRCKFAYAGGMSVTKYFEYVVQDSSITGNPTVRVESTLSYTVVNNLLYLSLSSVEQVAIYNAMGTCVYNAAIQNDSISLPKGVYIIVMGNRSYKVVV